MSKIKIYGNYSQIVDENDFEFLSKLDEYLSWKVPGAEYTRAFKGFVGKGGQYNRWDGTQRILTRKLEFPTGLVFRITEFYKSYGKEVEIEDLRNSATPNKEIDISANLIKLGKQPYPYQLDAVEAILKNDRGIVKGATGCGKTLILSLATAKIGKKTIVYVIGRDLLYQFHKFFSEVFDEKIGLIGDGHCDIQRINIASIWTLGQALGLNKNSIALDLEEDEKCDLSKKEEIIKLVEEAQVHILDEAHIAACETIGTIYKSMKSAEKIIGASGTPWRDDNADLLVEGYLGKNIIDISASFLIENGYLAKPIIKFILVPPMKVGSNYQAAYRDYVIKNPVRNNLVLKAAKTLVDQGYQTLVLFNNIAHGKILYDLISAEISECVLLDGSDTQEVRDKVKNDALSGKLKCIVASRIFDIGTDIPSLSGLVLASAGKSSVKALQRVGRVVRKFPNKTHAAIVDFADNCKFLDKHAKARYKIYSSESAFEVHWPKKKRKNKN